MTSSASASVLSRSALWAGLLVALLAVLVGRPAPAHAVVGGVPALEGEAPWAVALVSGRTDRVAAGHFCGGTLVRADTVVTAAHCLAVGGDEGLTKPGARDHDGARRLRLGVFTGRVLPLRSGPLERVRWVAVHPGFDDGAGYVNADIAVIRLRRPVSGAQILRLPAGAEAAAAAVAPGTALSVFGWGNRARAGENLPRELHRGDVERYTTRRCDERYGRAFNPVSQLCAGREDGSVDSCNGDSGGPLVSRGSDGAPVLVGVVSYGQGCADPEFPGVYTRVGRHRAWLQQVITAARRPAGAVGIRAGRPR